MAKKAPQGEGTPNRPGFFSKQVFRARLFYRDPKERAEGGLTVVCGGAEECAGDYRIDRETFPYWCVELVCRGRGSLFLPGDAKAAQPLRPGTLFVYGPGIAYRMESDPAEPLTKYFADFTGPRAGRLLRELGFAPGTAAQVFPLAPLAELFDGLIDAGLSGSPWAPRQGALRLESLLIAAAEGRIPEGTAETRAFATFQRCRSHLDETVPLLRNVREAAEGCHVDPAYLSRLFRRFARCSPHHYLTRRRLHAAAQRLMEPGRLVKEVAEEFGFADPYHFSRAFKRFHGVPPEEFARRRRKTGGR